MVLRNLYMAFMGLFSFFLVIDSASARSHINLKVTVRASGVVRLKIEVKHKRARANLRILVSRSQDPSQTIIIRRTKSKSKQILLRDTPPAPGTYYYRVKVSGFRRSRKNLWSEIVPIEAQIPDSTEPDPEIPFDPPEQPRDIDPHFELAEGLTDCEAGFEDSIINYTNMRRQENGVSSLAYNPHLAYAARRHSSRMALAQSMTHDGWFEEVWNDAGLHLPHLGQNIAAGFSDPLVLVDAWMGSPGHRFNMLKPVYSVTGISCVKDAQGYRWWSQNFGG